MTKLKLFCDLINQYIYQAPGCGVLLDPRLPVPHWCSKGIARSGAKYHRGKAGGGPALRSLKTGFGDSYSWLRNLQVAYSI